MPRPDNKARGGKNSCEAVLLARRLIEAGVPFVHLRMFSWDFHERQRQGLPQQLPVGRPGGGQPARGPRRARLAEDHDRRAAGRDGPHPLAAGRRRHGHATTGRRSSSSWPAAASRAAPSSAPPTSTRLQITDKFYKVESFGRTLYTLLGIDPDHEVLTTDGRPIKIVVNDAPIIKESLA